MTYVWVCFEERDVCKVFGGPTARQRAQAWVDDGPPGMEPRGVRDGTSSYKALYRRRITENGDEYGPTWTREAVRMALESAA